MGSRARSGIGALLVDAVEAVAMLLLGVHPAQRRPRPKPSPGRRRCGCAGYLPASTHAHRSGSCVPLTSESPQ